MVLGVAVTLIVLMLFGILFCFHRFVKRQEDKKNYSRNFSTAIVLTIIIDVCYLTTLLFPLGLTGRLTYSLYSALASWLVFFMLRFYMGYTGCSLKCIRFTLILIPALLFDTVSMMGNVFHQQAFSYIMAYTRDNDAVLHFKSNWLNNAHNIFCLVLACISLLVIVYKMLTANKSARIRYGVMLTLLLVLVLTETAYLFVNTVIDMTPFLFSALIIQTYFLFYELMARELLRSALTRVASEMKEMLIVLDEWNKCIYINESAREFFKKAGYSREQLQCEVGKWLKKNGESDYLCPSYAIAGKEKNYSCKVSFHAFSDAEDKSEGNGKYRGGFFILTDQTEEEERLNYEHYVAAHDMLTGLYNRMSFEKKVRERIDENPDEEYYLLCSDIREFKLINELFGADTADRLLKRIANALLKYSKPGWLYCRLTSDHFAMFIKKDEYVERDMLRALEYVEKLEEDSNYTVHIYVGVYEIKEREIPVSVMCDRAARAIATIKGSIQSIVFYDEVMQEKAEQAQRMASELPAAMRNREIRMFLQPQIDRDGNLRGAEALVRWDHPQKGLMMPGTFLPSLEDSGMVAILDQYIWKEACETLRRWDELGMSDISISVNISPVDIYFFDIYETLTSMVVQYGIDSGRLRLEITESAIARNLSRQMRLIDNLRGAGFFVEMDDFGSGYSSLNMLKDIQVDVLKVDMAFLRKSEDEEKAKAILQMIISLSRQIDLPVIIEGVETQEQVDFLKEIGSDFFQGFYFSKPMEVAEFEENYLYARNTDII